MNDTRKLDPIPGATIERACAEAAQVATECNCLVEFSCDGVTLTASPWSDAGLLVEKHAGVLARRQGDRAIVGMDVLCGTSISEACKEASEMARARNCLVTFNFNGIDLTVTPEADAGLIEEEYHREQSLADEKYMASPEYKRRQEEWAREAAEQQAKREAALVGAPAQMTLRDPEAWKASVDRNSDPYGAAGHTYAERWARMMEAEMSRGKKLEDVAEECSHLADEEGITGFMYGCAVSILSAVWSHGEELRRWHNLKTQLRDEGEKANESGGVLNPAMLSIGEPS